MRAEYGGESMMEALKGVVDRYRQGVASKPVTSSTNAVRDSLDRTVVQKFSASVLVGSRPADAHVGLEGDAQDQVLRGVRGLGPGAGHGGAATGKQGEPNTGELVVLRVEKALMAISA
jgi:hypothetical protein